MISVVVCTFNRGRMLEETVHSFLECGTGGIDHELLLVDNNSTDRTREFAERYATRNPRIRYLLEPLQGLQHARNRGIRESRGHIVAFADDDVYFSPSWLEAVASAFNRRSDIACIAGKVVPHFETERPAWLQDDLLDVYSISRLGDKEREIHPPEYPIGCNMAFRRSVFDRIGGFHTSLGREKGNLLSNDEVNFYRSLTKVGMKTLYVPDAQVSHRIPTDRLTRDWLLKRWYWQGISDVVMRQIGDEPLSRVILTKKAVKTFVGLLRRRGDGGALPRSAGGGDGNATIRMQIDKYYRLGTLRQMVAESLAIPGKSEVNK